MRLHHLFANNAREQEELYAIEGCANGLVPTTILLTEGQ